jgi:hypothetical protein
MEKTPLEKEVPDHIPVLMTKLTNGMAGKAELDKIKESADATLIKNGVEVYQMLYDFEDGSLLFKCRKK